MLAGPQATRKLSESHKGEISTAVPELAAAFDGGPCAQPLHPIIRGAVLKSFKERHQNNDAVVEEETGIFQHTTKQENAQEVCLQTTVNCAAHHVSARPCDKTHAPFLNRASG